MKFNWGVVVVAAVVGLTGCGEDVDQSSTQTQEPAPESGTPATEAATVGEMWQGEPKGYLSQGDSASDTTAFLVDVSLIDAHFSAYRELAQGRSLNSLTSEAIAALIDDDTLQAYQRVESRAIEETSVSTSLKPEIEMLTSSEMLSAMNENPNGKLPNWSQLNDRFRFWTQGAIEGVEGRYPKQILLARSALFRMAGDELALGLDIDGKTADTVSYTLGLAYFQSALEVGRSTVSLCDVQRSSTRATREAGYALRAKLYEGQANAGDVYELAAQTEKQAEALSPEGNDC